MGGVIDDIHLIQSLLNPLYKDLVKIGVSREKTLEIHTKVNDLLDGLIEEFPEMRSESKSADEMVSPEKSVDSDEDLFKAQSHRLRGTTELKQWLKYNHDASALKDLKFDSTPFWESSGRKLFPGLALLYYRFATKHASEAMIERFFSLAGYITSGRRANTGVQLAKATTMRHLWKE